MPAEPSGEPEDAERSARLDALTTEQVNPATVAIDRMSPLDIVRAMNAEDATVARAVARELPQIARAIEAIVARLRRGGRLLYVGAGTSGRLGALDALECPPTFNIAPEVIVGQIAGGSFALSQASEEYEDNTQAGQDDIACLAVTAADVVVGITASGRTPYVLGAVTAARARGALTIGLACNAAPPLFALVDLAIAPLVGAEVIAGSTRLKAGTAQKMVLNMLSTATMIVLGKTYGNLMVDVQPTNTKLRARAVEIVRQASGLERDAGAALLRACAGETKTAILAARAHLTPEVARARLTAHDGVLWAALAAGETRDATETRE
ncbi:MAG TPA: N-acetylmuramic acid 6-phosphate etherase [Ktedonobacterales bacterium]|nr:N-acetylmuramic acid 6-phosphate etherase [Ktedonobacterales bacterium]